LKGLKHGNESFIDLILRLTAKEMKGISSVLQWLEAMSEDDENLLIELSDSVEDVISRRDKNAWRSVEL